MDDAKHAFMEFERAGWNEVAAGYARVSEGRTSQITGPLLDAASVSAGTSVLDVATGPGWTAAAAAARGAAATGLDISTAMVAEARDRHPDLIFEQGAAEDLPFDDGSFDAVVSSFGMPHFYDHAAAFREFHRVLRPGGRVAVASWNPPATNPFFAIALGSIARSGSLEVDLPAGVDMFAWAEDDPVNELFSSTGFGPPERVQAELTFTTEDGPGTVLEVLQNASVRSRALFLGQTDAAKVAIAETISEMLAPMEDDGVWTIPATAFVVAAARI